MNGVLKHFDHMLLELSFEAKTNELLLGSITHCSALKHLVSVCNSKVGQ